MLTPQKYYVGLATTYHDPAIAIVNSEGSVLFAEASERPLQQKRAFSSAADLREVVRRILTEYCDPGSDFVVVKPWSRKMQKFMNFMCLLGTTNHELVPRRPEKMTKYLLPNDLRFGSNIPPSIFPGAIWRIFSRPTFAAVAFPTSGFLIIMLTQPLPVLPALLLKLLAWSSMDKVKTDQ